jgi:hypothetical protein
MLTWPSFFPKPQIAGNSRAPEDLSIRSSTETGPNLARQRSSFPLEKCPVSFVLVNEWLAVFDAYFHHKLDHGNAWFTITLAGETGAVPTVCRFVNGYSAKLTEGKHWNVTAEIEIDNTPRLTLAQYAATIAGSWDSLVAWDSTGTEWNK